MMRKFRFLVAHSLKRRLGKKSFLISQIFILVVTVLLINLGGIIALFNDGTQEKMDVLVFSSNDSTIAMLEAYDSDAEFSFSLSEEVFVEEKIDLYREDADIILIILEESSDYQATYYAGDLDILLQSKFEQYLASMRFELIFNSLPPEMQEELAKILKPMELKYVPFAGSDSVVDMILSAISTVLLLPIFIFTIMIVQMISMEIMEEKASRSIEIIISNVNPATHFYAKVTSTISWSFIQIALLFLYGVIGTVVSILLTGSNPIDSMTDVLGSLGSASEEMSALASVIARLPEILLVLLVFALLGFTFYVTLAALFSSMITTSEEYQQFQTPLMLILLAAFYLAIFGTMLGNGSNFINAFIYVPLVSALLTPVLFASGAIGIIEVIISGICLLVFIIVLIYFALPIYKAAILSYGNEKFWARIKKIFRNSRNLN